MCMCHVFVHPSCLSVFSVSLCLSVCLSVCPCLCLVYVQPASSLCSAQSLKALAKKDRAMLHDGGGLGFSVCHNDDWA